MGKVWKTKCYVVLSKERRDIVKIRLKKQSGKEFENAGKLVFDYRDAKGKAEASV